MPPLLTQVARLSDSLPLVATQTPSPGLPVSNKDQKEARDLLKKITAGYVNYHFGFLQPSCKQSRGGVVFSMSVPFVSMYACRLNLPRLRPPLLLFPSHIWACSANKMSIESGDRTFYYMTRENLCFLAMTESRYPKRTGFLYLDEVCDLILQELLKEFGNSVSQSE